MPSELQQNRYDQLIRRVGGIIGPGSKVSEALTELFPVLDVETMPAELLILGGTTLAVGSLDVTGVAANFSRAQLMNPVGSGKLITLTKCIFSSEAADQMRFGTQLAPITTFATTSAIRDTRLGIDSLPVGQMRFATAGFSSPNQGRIRVLANIPYTLEDENAIVVLAPGSGWEVGSFTADLDILVTFFWRERVAQQSELNF